MHLTMRAMRELHRRTVAGLLELAKLEFDLRVLAKRYQRKSSPDLGPAHQDFVH
jgi:hypothetical protein